MTPFRRFVGLLMMLALVATVAMGCATDPAVRAYQAGDISRTTAEGAYAAIYRAYTGGLVSEPDMAKARTAYDAWADTQRLYVAAAKEGKPTGEYATYVSRYLTALINLAAKYQLI